MYDVAIVGCGPTGMVLAALLGQRGYRVFIHDRRTALYPLSRAGHMDDEALRILQAVGVASDILEKAYILKSYQWINQDMQNLLFFDWSHPGACGWPSHISFYSPDLDNLLLKRLQSLSTVTVRQGWEAAGFKTFTDHVELEIRETEGGASEILSARYLVGADGANSFVRAAAGLSSDNRGFSEKWLVIDYRPNDIAICLDKYPETAQLCFPSRPISWFRQLGREHMRWEFMLLEGESDASFDSDEACYKLLDGWVTPDDGNIIRRAVYKFDSALATEWRNERVLIAGDAAHLTPPFLGQGMCSGMRDAINLEWKLDAVLSGKASGSLLDSYGKERRPHTGDLVDMAVELGKIVCQRDPVKAAARDAFLLSGDAPPPPPLPRHSAGMFEGEAMPAGQLSPQGRIEIDGQTGRWDDVVGRGWALITDKPELRDRLSPSDLETLRRLGGRAVVLAQTTGEDAIDLDGTYASFLSAHGVDFILVRPDFYIQSAGNVAMLSSALSGIAARMNGAKV